MAGRMSSRDRLANLQAEAAAKQKEKDAAKVARDAAKASAPAKKGKAPAKATPGRVRIVWHVCDPSGAPVQTFPYAQEAEAQAEAKRRTAEAGKTHFVTKAEEPLA